MRVEEDYFFLSFSLSGERGRNIYEDEVDERNRERERFFHHTILLKKQKQTNKRTPPPGFSSSFFLTT
jgi:hypothetical protein